MAYFLNIRERAIVDGDTGDIVHPSCWDDLSPYYSYLVERGHEQLAQSVLRDVMKGEKVISKMIAASQKRRGDGQ